MAVNPRARTFSENNVTHLARTAEVVFVKQIKNFQEPGSDDNAEISYFQTEYAEFLTGRQLLREATALDDSWPNPNDTSEPLYRHYYVVASSEPLLRGASVVGQATAPESNADVTQVSATTTVEGRGRCSITLNSREDKYLFTQNPFRKGQTVFSQNDWVYVNLPGLDGVLRRVFTGLITDIHVEVVTQGGTLQTLIHLDCEDMLKKLAQSRTNVTPSLDVAEALGARIASVNPSFAGKLPHEILAYVLSRALADKYTNAGTISALDGFRRSARGGSRAARELAAENEHNHVDQLFSLSAQGAPVLGEFQYTGFFAIQAADTATVTPAAAGLLTRPSQDPITIPRKIFGLRKRRTTSQFTTVYDRGAGESGPLPFVDPDDVAFVISGTRQPAFQASFIQSVALYGSEWKSGLEVCQRIATELNFELFADAYGVVRVRPVNIALPFEFEADAPRQTTKQLGSSHARVGVDYWLDEKFIQTQDYVDTDRGVYTIAYINGGVAQIDQASLPIGLVKGVAVDLARLLRLGPRIAPPIQKLNLLDDAACTFFARAYLSRLNAAARSARVTYTGDARLAVGNPVFIPHRNEVYYISSITHDFTVGDSYRTILTLTYGRKPLARADNYFDFYSSENNNDLTILLGEKTLSSVLRRLELQDDDDTITGVYFPDAQREASYIRSNETNLKFQGFIWEPMYTLTYEDLLADHAQVETAAKLKTIGENAKVNSRDALVSFTAALQRARVGDSAATLDDQTVLSAMKAMRGKLGLP